MSWIHIANKCFNPNQLRDDPAPKKSPAGPKQVRLGAAARYDVDNRDGNGTSDGAGAR